MACRHCSEVAGGVRRFFQIFLIPKKPFHLLLLAPPKRSLFTHHLSITLQLCMEYAKRLATIARCWEFGKITSSNGAIGPIARANMGRTQVRGTNTPMTHSPGLAFPLLVYCRPSTTCLVHGAHGPDMMEFPHQWSRPVSLLPGWGWLVIRSSPHTPSVRNAIACY